MAAHTSVDTRHGERPPPIRGGWFGGGASPVTAGSDYRPTSRCNTVTLSMGCRIVNIGPKRSLGRSTVFGAQCSPITRSSGSHYRAKDRTPTGRGARRTVQPAEHPRQVVAGRRSLSSSAPPCNSSRGLAFRDARRERRGGGPGGRGPSRPSGHEHRLGGPRSASPAVRFPEPVAELMAAHGWAWAAVEARARVQGRMEKWHDTHLGASSTERPETSATSGAPVRVQGPMPSEWRAGRCTARQTA